MIKYPVKVGEREAKAAGIGLPISTKNSIIICRKINKMKTEKAKKFLQDMIEGKRNINRKHYTKTCTEILKVIESAENNAKNMGIERTAIKTISVEKGARRLRMKRRRSFGSELKNTNIKIILKEIKERKKNEPKK